MSLLVLFCSVSCKDNGMLIGDGGESPTDEYVDNYLYTMIGSTLYSISPYSASVVPVCPDPLCFHNDSGCPFFNVDETSVETVGKYIYYLKDGNGWGEYAQRLCRFDRESGKFEVVYEPEEGSLLNLSLNTDELYFNLAYIDKNLQNTFDVCRLELSDGSVETLTDEPTKESHRFMCEKDGRLYFRSLKTVRIKSGDFIEMEIFHKGSGKFTLQYIAYGVEDAKHSKFLSTLGTGKPLAASEEDWKQHRVKVKFIPPKRAQGKYTDFSILPVIMVYSDAEIVFDDFKLKVIPAK